MIFPSFESVYGSYLCEADKRVNPQNEFNLPGQRTALVATPNTRPAHRLSSDPEHQASAPP